MCQAITDKKLEISMYLLEIFIACTCFNNLIRLKLGVLTFNLDYQLCKVFFHYTNIIQVKSRNFFNIVVLIHSMKNFKLLDLLKELEKQLCIIQNIDCTCI
jgi:hypothetical protein